MDRPVPRQPTGSPPHPEVATVHKMRHAVEAPAYADSTAHRTVDLIGMHDASKTASDTARPCPDSPGHRRNRLVSARSRPAPARLEPADQCRRAVLEPGAA